MEEEFIADYHIHRVFSDDSDCPAEEMIRQAVSLGLDEIAFTDHVDYGVKTELNCDFEKYFQTLNELRMKYANEVTIKIGIEFGVQVHTIEQYEKDFEAYPFDFVILSNHQVDNKEFWNYAYQEGKTQEVYQRAYYQGILDVIKIYKGYSVLGHLDMIKRYDKCGDYPDEKVMDLVVPILQQVIRDGKGIELNTSNLNTD